MLNASLSGDLFRKGIVGYLKKFSGSNTVTDDLWNSIAQVRPCMAARARTCVSLCDNGERSVVTSDGEVMGVVVLVTSLSGCLT